MYRVWYSTESFGDYIIDHTVLADYCVEKSRMYLSDAENPANFHTMPDHIKKILYLDAPDLIVEWNSEPIFTIEVSTEAGTGHNVFQRFARIAASVENEVPTFYIYPEAVMVSRRNSPPKWDKLNPLILRALEEMMSIYDIPALFYFFPTDYAAYPNAAEAPSGADKGINFEPGFKYLGCPKSDTNEMQDMFRAINEVISLTQKYGVLEGRQRILRSLIIRERRALMSNYYHEQGGNMNMSPLTSTVEIPTEYLLNYLSSFNTEEYQVGELLRLRERTVIYRIDANFRGDPYAGCLAAIDYLKCREGKTFEERRHNLVLSWGILEVDDSEKTIRVRHSKNITINDFFNAVQNSESRNLLARDYNDLKSHEIPRYYMQVRYGSTYSKPKHIRVFAYFADAVLFPDGSLWRDG